MRPVAQELCSGTCCSDAAFGEIALPDKPSRNWRTNLRVAARETRIALKRHPGAFLVAGAEMPDERGFEYGLDCVLEGVAARIKPRRRA